MSLHPEISLVALLCLAHLGATLLVAILRRARALKIVAPTMVRTLFLNSSAGCDTVEKSSVTVHYRVRYSVFIPPSDDSMTSYCVNRSELPQVNSYYWLAKPLTSGLILSAGLLLASCISIEGQSSGEIKSNLQNSYLVKSVKRFYPGGVPEDLEQIDPHLGDREEQEIRSELEKLKVTLHRLHKEKYERLNPFFIKKAKEFTRDFPGQADLPNVLESFSSRIELVKNDSTAAFTDREGKIVLDLRVLQALFRGALLENSREHGSDLSNPFGITFGSFIMPSRPFDTHYDPSKATLEQREAIERWYDLVQQIEETEGRSVAGDFWESFSSDSFEDPSKEGSWSRLTEIALRSDILQAQYLGSVLFLLAHEHGHLALQHYSRLQALEQQISQDPALSETILCHYWRAYLEVEADFYALLLISPYTANKPVFPMQDLRGIGQHMTGYRNFFQYGYALSGFQNGSGDVCLYPTNEARYDFVEKLNMRLVEKRNVQMFDLKNGSESQSPEEP